MKLREWLYRKRLTIRDFSDLLGYDRTYIHCWMNGSRIPSKRTLDAVKQFTFNKVKKFDDLRD